MGSEEGCIPKPPDSQEALMLLKGNNKPELLEIDNIGPYPRSYRSGVDGFISPSLWTVKQSFEINIVHGRTGRPGWAQNWMVDDE
jgi:hypothetical protein